MGEAHGFNIAGDPWHNMIDDSATILKNGFAKDPCNFNFISDT